MDLLPLRPQPEDPCPLALGAAPAGSVPDRDDADLRSCPQERRPLALPAAGRAAPGEEGGGRGRRRREGGVQEERGEEEVAQGGGDRSRRAPGAAVRSAGAARQLRG